jgi:hypothetical protein
MDKVVQIYSNAIINNNINIFTSPVKTVLLNLDFKGKILTVIIELLTIFNSFYDILK